MKRKITILFAGVTLSLLLIGCGTAEEDAANEVEKDNDIETVVEKEDELDTNEETEVVVEETEVDEEATNEDTVETEVDEEVTEEETERVLTEDEIEKIKEEVTIVLNNNIKYAESEDIDNYMNTMYIDETYYEIVKQDTLKLFDELDLDYEISEPDFIQVTESNVAVRVFQTNVKVDGKKDYKDNIAEALHNFINVDGEWKLFSSEVLGVEFINTESSN